MARKKGPADAPLLNPEQQAVSLHVNGPLLVSAGAGSGKTTAVVERIVNLMRNNAVPSHRILMLSFSQTAAKEVGKRLKARLPDSDLKSVFRTFHSLALEIHKHEVHDQTSVLDHNMAITRYAFKTCRDRVDGGRAVTWESFKLFASMVKNDFLGRNPVFAQLGATDPRMGALADRVAAHCRLPSAGALLDLYYAYEHARRQGTEVKLAKDADPQVVRWTNFDELLYDVAWMLANPDVRQRWQTQWDYVIQDEAQDMCETQNVIAEYLAEQHRNYMIVGDPGQCHPAGTLISTSGATGIEWRPIQDLVDQEESVRISSWNRNAQKMVHGRRYRVASRPFDGELRDVEAADRVVSMTPDHKVLARWTDRSVDTCVTYLMWREGFGYRVGWCKLFAGNGQGSLQFHLAQRAKIEKAEKSWILKTHASRTDASVHESVIAATYGLPTATFEPVAGAAHLTADAIARIFHGVEAFNGANGARCLRDHGRDPHLPLWPYPTTETDDPDAKYRRGTYFTCYAANIEASLMSLPLPDAQNAWTPVQSTVRRPFSGPVYSLDVEKDHSYAANGVVVLNCIFEWRGARPEKLISFKERWKNSRVIALDRNYRSGKSIIEGANAMLRSLRDYEKLPIQLRGERADNGFMVLHEFESFDKQADAIAANCKAHYRSGVEWKEMAVLVRTVGQAGAIEVALNAADIPTKSVGSSMFDVPEVRTLFAWYRVALGKATAEHYHDALQYPYSNRIGRDFADLATKEAPPENVSWLDHIESFAPKARIPRAVDSWLDLVSKFQREGRAQTPGQLLLRISREACSDIISDAVDDVGDRDADENHKKLIDLASDFASHDLFLDKIDRMLANREKHKRTRNVVIISTVHRAKGEEWSVVFVPGVSQGVFPHKKGEAEEEKRIFYVAMTRARDELWLSRAIEDMYGETLPSQFVETLGIQPQPEFRPGVQRRDRTQMTLI